MHRIAVEKENGLLVGAEAILLNDAVYIRHVDICDPLKRSH